MVYLLIALLILSGDLIVKSKIVEIPENVFPIEKCNGRIRFVRTYNEGMANNLMEQEPEKVKKISTIALVIFTILSLPMLLSKKTRKIRKLGIGLVIGGAASNVADRRPPNIDQSIPRFVCVVVSHVRSSYPIDVMLPTAGTAFALSSSVHV